MDPLFSLIVATGIYVYVYMFIQIRLNIYIPKNNLLNLYIVTCLFVFRPDQFLLVN